MRLSAAQMKAVKKVDAYTWEATALVQRVVKSTSSTGKSTAPTTVYAALPCQMSVQTQPNPTPVGPALGAAEIHTRAVVSFPGQIPGEAPEDDPVDVMIIEGDTLTIEGRAWIASADAEWASGFSDLHRVQVHRLNRPGAN